MYSPKNSQRTIQTLPYISKSQTNNIIEDSIVNSIYSQINTPNKSQIENLLYKPNSINWKKRHKSKPKSISHLSTKLNKKNYKKITKKISNL